YEQIDVALRTCLAASDGPENADGSRPVACRDVGDRAPSLLQLQETAFPRRRAIREQAIDRQAQGSCDAHELERADVPASALDLRTSRTVQRGCPCELGLGQEAGATHCGAVSVER